MEKNILKDKSFLVTLLLFIGLTALRIVLLLYPGEENYNALVWGSIYQIMALWGAFFGIHLSRFWGGYKSVIGRATLAFACGLLAQSFGQSVSSYDFYKGSEVLYPAIGDVGFFGSIPLYIYGALLLARASGVSVSLKSFEKKIQAILCPLALLAISYFFFLRGYSVDWSQPVKTFLDFGYPLGQAIYVSIAILTFILSRKILGGLMRLPTLFFLAALITQYFCDFIFLYQSSRGTYIAGGLTDYLYFTAYSLMSLSLIQLGLTYKKIQRSN